MAIWNPWHGCKKISPGCINCYVYRRDAEFGKDSSIITKTVSFELPVKRDRMREYKLQPGGECVYTCMISDFFLEEADVWSAEAWKMTTVFVLDYQKIGEMAITMLRSVVHVRTRTELIIGCLFLWNSQSSIVR